MTLFKSLIFSLLSLFGFINSALAAPEIDWPKKPMVAIVSFPAGGSTDIFARSVTAPLADALGQSIVVENKPGAGGMIGAEAAAAMPGDGYNLFFTVKGPMAIAPHIYPNAKYNPLKDFKAISQILIVPHILTATPNAPYNTMKEMVEYAKRNPGKIDYASAGVGSQPHSRDRPVSPNRGRTWTPRWVLRPRRPRPGENEVGG